MVSLQLSSMWQSRMVQKYCPSYLVCHKQQLSWCAACNFSKSAGPVRYSPKITKQPKNEQEEGLKSPQNFVKEIDKQVPPMPSHQHTVKEVHKQGPRMPSPAHRFQGPGLAELLPLGCDLAKQEVSLDEEEDLPSGFVKTQHTLETRGRGVRDSNRSSVNSGEVFEAYTSMRGVPMNSADFLHQVSGTYPKEACMKFTYKEEDNRATVFSSKHAAEVQDEGARQSQGSSADLARSSLPRTMQQTRVKEVRGSVSPIFDQGNGLNRPVENAQKKKNPFMDSKVEDEACLLAAQSTSPLPLLGQEPRKRERIFQEGKQLPCQDVESFLLKLQKAKQAGLQSRNKSQAAVSAEGDVCVDYNYESDDIDDNSCMFWGQEAFQKTEDLGLDSKSTAAREHAKNQAVQYLALRPYTAFQLKKKLEGRDITSELADYAIATVQKCGLQSDLSYAETFSRARFNNSSWGPQRIKLGLQQKGISKEIIEIAIAKVFREEENGADEQCGTCDEEVRTTKDKMSRAAMDQLLVRATKQWNRGRDATIETRVRRMVAWLQYRGFNYGVIKAVLKHLQEPY